MYFQCEKSEIFWIQLVAVGSIQIFWGTSTGNRIFVGGFTPLGTTQETIFRFQIFLPNLSILQKIAQIQFNIFLLEKPKRSTNTFIQYIIFYEIGEIKEKSEHENIFIVKIFCLKEFRFFKRICKTHWKCFNIHKLPLLLPIHER